MGRRRRRADRAHRDIRSCAGGIGRYRLHRVPEVGTALSAGDSMGSIESVKTVSELYCPVSGTVTKVNTDLEDSPEKVNSEPYEGGWIAEVELEGDPEEAMKHLLTAEGYRKHIE